MSSLQAYLTEKIVQHLPFMPDTGWILDAAVDTILVFALLIITWLVHVFGHLNIARFLTSLIKKSNSPAGKEFINSRIIKRMARLIPTLLLWKLVPEIIRNDPTSNFSEIVLSILLAIVSLSVLFSVLNITNRLYQKSKSYKKRPINGIIDTAKILLSIGAGILILSVILGKSPALIFSGLGAITAILILVFRDPILGLAAGLQLSSHELIAVGDWIEVPKYGADGEVLELGLTTVKVQNWDKTITMIPTYSLISESFKNWNGMSESGIRRIKRSLNIDVNTIRFLDDEEIATLKEHPLLKDYLTDKELCMEKKNPAHPQKERRLSNIGTYRAYLTAYLEAHVLISDKGKNFVRQLQSTPHGLPIEIYCFSKDNNWINYENIQSDLFDHFLSVLPLFDLRLFQEPTGNDFQKLRV